MADPNNPQTPTPAPQSPQGQSPQNVDEDQFFNQYKPNVSEDDFFGKYNPQNANTDAANKYWFNKGPYEGSLSDYLFTQSPTGRILSAFGQGAHDAWGANGGTIYGDELKWESEHQKEDKSLVYGFHTSVMRPATAAIDSIVKGGFSLFGGVAGATGQTGVELTDYSKEHPILGAPAGAAGELLKEAASGAIPEELVHAPEYSKVPDHVQTLQEARSKGIIGEGESSYYKTRPITPEEQQGRNEAAVNAGYGPETLEQWKGPDVVPTQHELARQIDPDTFKELDNLQEQKEILQTTIQAEITKRRQALETGTSPEHPEILKQETAILDRQERLQKVDEGLRDLIPDVNSARQRTGELLDSQGPEGDAFRDLVQRQALEKAIKLQELKSKVVGAYRDAADLIPAPVKDANETATASPKSSALNPKAPTPAQQILNDTVPAFQEAGKLKPVKGGPEAPSGLNKNIQSDAIQKGFEARFGNDPLYNKITHADQGQKAFEYSEADPKTAMEVAMGDREPPDGIFPEAILLAVKEKAEAEGDIQTLQDLAQTRLGGQASIMGQRLGLLRNLYDDIDPVQIIKNIQDSWRDKGNKKIDKTIAEIQKSVQASLEKFQPDWEAFIKSIECK